MLARRWRRLGVSLLALASWLALAGGPARGQDAQPTYETRRVQLFLNSERLVEDPQPEGKTVAYVRCVRRDVLEADDPIVLAGFAPTWPNYFHWRSDEVTVRREVLLRAGAPYVGSRAEETTRNLRDLGIFSLVRVVAVQVRDPRQVGVIVYTRDLWSLRLEQQFAGAGSTFSLGLQLVERNFLGRGKSLAANFILEPLRYVAGQSYLDPRVSGGELRLYEALSLFINRGSGVLEGSSGTLLFGRPFYNLAQRVSFDLLGQYADYVFRAVPDGHVAGFDASPGARHGAECQLGAPQCLPRVWDDRSVKLETALYLRAGERYTQTWSAGAGFQDRAVAANAETGLAPTQRAVFEREVLPRVRRSAYPFARYRLDLPTYAVFTNLGTFGQSEPVQTGPRLDARFELPLSAFGSSSNGFVTRGSLGYVWAQHDALLDVVTSAAARLDAGQLVDEHGLLRVRGASPTLPWVRGRLVFRGIWDERRRDTQRTLVALGGDTGLRGYSLGHFYGFGASYLVANVEYRTPPLALQSVHLGLVAFYDAGSVYRDFSQARGHHAAGLGLRVLLPQFNRYVFRLDCGAPLDSPGFGVVLSMFSYGSEQPIALTPGEDALVPTTLDLN
jgi:hypothetical protein